MAYPFVSGEGIDRNWGCIIEVGNPIEEDWLIFIEDGIVEMIVFPIGINKGYAVDNVDYI